MGGLYVLLGGMMLFAVVIVLLDYLGERRERRSRAATEKPH